MAYSQVQIVEMHFRILNKNYDLPVAVLRYRQVAMAVVNI